MYGSDWDQMGMFMKFDLGSTQAGIYHTGSQVEIPVPNTRNTVHAM